MNALDSLAKPTQSPVFSRPEQDSDEDYFDDGTAKQSLVGVGPSSKVSAKDKEKRWQEMTDMIMRKHIPTSMKPDIDLDTNDSDLDYLDDGSPRPPTQVGSTRASLGGDSSGAVTVDSARNRTVVATTEPPLTHRPAITIEPLASAELGLA